MALQLKSYALQTRYAQTCKSLRILSFMPHELLQNLIDGTLTLTSLLIVILLTMIVYLHFTLNIKKSHHPFLRTKAFAVPP